MTMDQYHEIIGTGWAFPLGANGRGGIAMSRGETDIEQAIRIILGTAKGERRMRPNFGCQIHDLVFGQRPVEGPQVHPRHGPSLGVDGGVQHGQEPGHHTRRTRSNWPTQIRAGLCHFRPRIPPDKPVRTATNAPSDPERNNAAP